MSWEQRLSGMKKILASTLLVNSLPLSADETPKMPMLLPPVVYAVPGVEMNVYFGNIVCVGDLSDYEFDVDCPKGRNDSKRWTFTPEESDTGAFTWKLSVLKDGIILGTGEMQLLVAPVDAGNGREISYLAVGASTTASTHYPNRIYELMQKQGNPKFKMVGSACWHRKPKLTDTVVHEGYGGWTYGTFLRKEESPFLFDGKLDFKAYCEAFNGGQAPDFISVMLGANSAFATKDSRLAEDAKKMADDMEVLVREFRRVGPDSQIGIALVYPCAATQDAFGANYKCGMTRARYIRYQFAFSNELIARIKKLDDPKISIVPNTLNLDGENNFPAKEVPVNAANPRMILRQTNALHPAESGYIQYGDTFYCWLKGRLWQAEK